MDGELKGQLQKENKAEERGKKRMIMMTSKQDCTTSAACFFDLCVSSYQDCLFLSFPGVSTPQESRLVLTVSSSRERHFHV